jgi:Calx-beta domain-containing protein
MSRRNSHFLRTLTIILCVVLPLSFAACHRHSEEAASSDDWALNFEGGGDQPQPSPSPSPAIPSVEFEKITSTASENGGAVVVNVRISSPSSQTVQIAFADIEGSAKRNEDFQIFTPSPLIFTPGEVLRSIRVQLIDNNEQDGSKAFSIQLKNPLHATLGDKSFHTIIISDDDIDEPQPSQPSISFLTNNITLNEGMSGNTTVGVKLSQASDEVVSVRFKAVDIEAENGTDYTLNAGYITFAPGSTSMSINIEITDDTLSERHETFSIALEDPLNATLGNPSIAIVRILDDDAPTVGFTSDGTSMTESNNYPTITVKLSQPSEQQITVNHAIVAGGSATEDEDFKVNNRTPIVFVPGETSKYLELVTNLIDDDIIEGDESYSIILTSADSANIDPLHNTFTVTIKDNDAEIALPTISFNNSTLNISENISPTMTLRAKLSEPAPANLAIPITISGTATNGADFSTTYSKISIPAGITEGTILIDMIDDAVWDPNETITITMQADSNNPPNYLLGTPSQMTITITDDDAEPPRVSFSKSSSLCKEYAASVGCYVYVELDKAAPGDVDLDIAFNHLSTATPGEDYTTDSSTATIRAGRDNAYFKITPINDDIAEDAETITLKLIIPEGILDGNILQHTITIDRSDHPDQKHRPLMGIGSNEETGEGELLLYTTIDGPAQTGIAGTLLSLNGSPFLTKGNYDELNEMALRVSMEIGPYEILRREKYDFTFVGDKLAQMHLDRDRTSADLNIDYSYDSNGLLTNKFVDDIEDSDWIYTYTGDNMRRDGAESLIGIATDKLIYNDAGFPESICTCDTPANCLYTVYTYDGDRLAKSESYDGALCEENPANLSKTLTLTYDGSKISGLTLNDSAHPEEPIYEIEAIEYNGDLVTKEKMKARLFDLEFQTESSNYNFAKAEIIETRQIAYGEPQQAPIMPSYEEMHLKNEALGNFQYYSLPLMDSASKIFMKRGN